MKTIHSAIIIILVIIAMSAVWFFQVITFTSADRQPSENEFDAVQRSLISDRIVNIASPDRTRWNSGDTGIYHLGVKNRHDSATVFHVNIYLESLDAELAGTDAASLRDFTSTWFSYNNQMQVQAEGISMNPVTMRIPPNSQTGSYKFRVIVCEDSDCADMDSARSLYGTTTIPVYVTG